MKVKVIHTCLGLSFKKKVPTKEINTNLKSEVNSVLKSKNNKSEINSDLKFNHSLLYHERKNSSDSYSYKKKDPSKKFIRSSEKTLGSNRLFSWYSSTYINNQKNLRFLGFSASALLLLISLLNLCPVVLINTAAEAIGQEIASETELNMVAEYTEASLNLLVKDSSGSFAVTQSGEEARLKVTTNNYTGYTLTISGDDSGELINEEESAALSSIEYPTPESAFASAEFYNGSWGYLPNKYNGVNNSVFRPAPSSSADTLDKTSVANASSANEYKISLGARADYNVKSGSYTGTFALAAVANTTPYTITYTDNTGDSSVENLPASSVSTSAAAKVAISSDIPVRSGYTFAGWCSVAATVNSDGSATCSGTKYNASTAETPSYIGLDQTASSNIASLYALWNLASYSLTINFAGSGVLEVEVRTRANTSGTLIGTAKTSGATVSSLNYNTTYYLRPVFTENHSFVSWENTGAHGSLSSTSYSNPAFRVGAGAGSVTVTGKQTYLTMQELTLSTCAVSASLQPLTVVDSRDNQPYTVRYINGGCYMTSNLRFVGTSIDTTNTNVATANNSITWKSLKDDSECKGTSNTTDNTTYWCKESGTDNLGNPTVWYNYAAASAGTITGTSNDINDAYNICPKGWTLPNKDQFSGITSYVTFSPVYGGIYGNGTLYGASMNGNWWSSTASATTDRYYLVYNNGLLGTDNFHRRGGFYIRCVLSSASNAATLQSVSSSMAANTAVGTTLTLTDSRDGQAYTVKKLADGRLWMIDNLNLGAETLTEDLSSSNTNMSGTISASTFNSWNRTTSGTGTSYTAPKYTPVSGTDATSNTAYGTLYNYCAASVNTYCYESTDTENHGNAKYDLCPAGWRLPKGGASGEFQTLYNIYNNNARMRAPISSDGAAFALPGVFTSAAPEHQGTSGFYWSSSRSDATYMYGLYIDESTGVYPYAINHHNEGRSIRCIKKTPLEDVFTMQGVTDDLIASTPSSASTTLTDSRDGQEYTVVKYNNLLWMTRNLAIGCNGSGSTYGSSVSSKTLTSANSNVSSSWNTPTLLLTDDNGKNSYDNAAIKCDSTYGAWYNYAAATAGTIAGGSNETEASSSICPSGWRLFTKNEGITETAFKDVFSLVHGGYYYDGTLYDASTSGFWWSSTAGSTAGRYGLYYNYGSLVTSNSGRCNGRYVRCVRAAS